MMSGIGLGLVFDYVWFRHGHQVPLRLLLVSRQEWPITLEASFYIPPVGGMGWVLQKMCIRVRH